MEDDNTPNSKVRRIIPQKPEKILSAPDYHLNLLDWGSTNVLTFALEIQIWDSTANRKLRTLRGGHRSGVGSMAWNNHILTTGGHTHEVCGLKWSSSGQQLASGGGDHLLHIWDRRSTQWLHRLEEHTAAVKALVWCPFRGNLLETG
ncbi:hypothetical protein Q3G72_031521 [Acer saccharum]|nr:hypothetical protein Q3G72_031521 [Acer saccharum]